MIRKGLPPSNISGSKLVCGSPKLIAAYHVLLRLLVPSHSPLALTRLITEILRLTFRMLKNVSEVKTYPRHHSRKMAV